MKTWTDVIGQEKEKPYFERIRLIGEVEDPYAREKGTRIYLLENAKVDVNKILAQDIHDKKTGKD